MLSSVAPCFSAGPPQDCSFCGQPGEIRDATSWYLSKSWISASEILCRGGARELIPKLWRGGWMRGRCSHITKERSFSYKTGKTDIECEAHAFMENVVWKCSIELRFDEVVHTHTHTHFIHDYSIRYMNSQMWLPQLLVQGHQDLFLIRVTVLSRRLKEKQKIFVPSMQPFAESDAGWKRDGSEAWKRLRRYNQITWKTDLEQMQNTTRGRPKRRKRTQGGSRCLWWPEWMEFKCKSLISPQCSSAPSQEGSQDEANHKCRASGRIWR